MKALVTGAFGFAGKHLVGELARAGWEVVATDIVESPLAEEGGARGGSCGVAYPGEARYDCCDIRDKEAVMELVSRERPDAVFHLAAQSSSALSFDDPGRTLEANVFGTLHVLEAARRAGQGARMRVLTIGSSEEYGIRRPEEMPLGEESRIEPASPYAVSKAAQTMLSMQYAGVYGLDVVVARSFSHTGAGQTDRFVLPSFARRCAEIRQGLHEPVIEVGNLDVVRDFLDVRDVVRAYRVIVERGARGTAYNVCSGTGLALRSALEFLLGRVSAPVAIRQDERLLRPSDIPVLVGNNARLRALGRWEREIPAERMLADLLDYWDRQVLASIA